MSVWLRILTWCLALGLIALPLAAVMHGWLAPQRWPIKQLAVTAEYQHVGEDAIKATVVEHMGQGYFDTEPTVVRDALAALPWVATVEVRKRWPDRLEVRLSEHHAKARWGAQRMLADDGVLFRAPAAASDVDLPQLSGPDDRAAEVYGFYQQAHGLLAGAGLGLQGVRLSRRGSWSLQLVDGASVVIGREADPQPRLRRWLKAMPSVMQGQTRALARVDLRYTNGFTVRWAEPPAAPTVPPDSSSSVMLDECGISAWQRPALACERTHHSILAGFKA